MKGESDKTLVSIDPGKSTGLICGTYSDEEPFRLEFATQIEGGVEGFANRVRNELQVNDHHEGFGEIIFSVLLEGPTKTGFDHWTSDGEITFLSEKFTARGGGQGFSYRTDALEPLRVEGAMIAMKMNPEWCDPRFQYFAGGKKKAEKKKLSHAWLKEHGLYIAPKDVGCSDADDARSALLHAIAWLRRTGHKPTIEHYFGEE